MSGSIGYLDAWRQWLDGQQPSPDLQLGFMSIRWWGRAGKIAAFFGGGTIILDLIGPDRLRAVARDRGSLKRFGDQYLMVSAYATIFAAGLVTAYLGTWDILPSEPDLSGVVLFLGLGLMLGAGSLAAIAVIGPGLMIRILDTERPAQVLRYFALAFLAVGFHFDLLAS